MSFLTITDEFYMSLLAVMMAALIWHLWRFLLKVYLNWLLERVPCVLPYIGNNYLLHLFLTPQLPVALAQEKVYKKLCSHKYGWYFVLTKPILMIRDPDLIRMILHSSSFRDRKTGVDDKEDPLALSLNVMDGPRWKFIRSKISLIFSTNNLKEAHNQHTLTCIQDMDQYLKSEIAQNGGEINLTEFMYRLTTDLIGSFTLGEFTRQKGALQVEVDSEFRRLGRLKSRDSQTSLFWNLVQALSPKLVSAFRKKEVSKQDEQFFMSVVESAKQRLKKSQFIQEMLKAQVEEETKDDPHCTDNVIAAVAFHFVTVASETLGLFLTYLIYEVSLEQPVLEKLYDEIRKVKKTRDLDDYDTMKKLTYLDMVIKETLRKHPGAPALGRICTKAFTIPDTDFTIEKGTQIKIPIHAIHRDETHHPKPEKFDPERFRSQNMKNIKAAGTYLPFGGGPRGCVGERFAMDAIKALMAHVVANYTIKPTAKTMEPLEYDCRKSFVLAPAKDLWVRFERRV